MAAIAKNRAAEGIFVSIDDKVVGSILVPIGQKFTPLTTEPFTISTTGNHKIALIAGYSYGGVGVLLDQVRLLIPTTSPDILAPGWAEDVFPMDQSDAGGNGPSSSEHVQLASGVKENTPGPDITVYNPVGPSVRFERTYHSSLFAHGHTSPGLTGNWTHNFDLGVSYTGATGQWSPLLLSYSNGAADTWTPILSNGTPTGNFSLAPGTPYTVTGIPSTTVGQWQSVSMVFKRYSV